MRTTNFDAVAASAPLNREASTIRDGSGDLWEPRKAPENVMHWGEPPLPLEPKPAQLPELSGKAYGRLTVIRYHGKPNGGKNAKGTWLVRCACGDYEVRRTEAIVRGLSGVRHEAMEPSCYVCTQVQAIQIQARKASTKASRKASAALLDRLSAEAKR